MRVSPSLCLGLVFAFPVGAGAFVAGGWGRPDRAPRIGEAVRYDGGDAEGPWVVVRRVRGETGVALEIRNGDDVAIAAPGEVRPVGRGWPAF